MRFNEITDDKDRAYQETEYYKEYGAGGLYVGIETNTSNILGFEGFHNYRPKTRKPVDTNIVLHTLTNHLSEKMLGVPIRSGIFTTKSKDHAALFGNTIFRIIPNDGYVAYYNPNIKDFTVDTKLKKQDRSMVQHLMKYKTTSDSIGYKIKHMRVFLEYLNERYESINYDNFVKSVHDIYMDYISTLKSDEHVGNSVETIKEVFNAYHADSINYIKGMERIEDFENVKGEHEIIMFPYEGFWFI